MSDLLSLYSLNEAGSENKPTREPKSKKRWPDDFFSEPDDDVPEFGTSDDDVTPDAPEAEPDVEDEPEPPEEPEEPVTRFASKSEPPRRRSEEEVAGLRISGDRPTLAALRDALSDLADSGRDEDIMEWLDDCVRAIDQATRRNADSVTLPKFEATPSLADFDDDEGGTEDEEY